MDVAKASSRLKKYLLFENIHMVNEDGFNKCRIDRSDSLLFKCDQSLKVNSLKFELVMFHSMNWNGWSFKENSTYYFISKLSMYLICTIYRISPPIGPWLFFVSKAFLVGLSAGELIREGRGLICGAK